MADTHHTSLMITNHMIDKEDKDGQFVYPDRPNFTDKNETQKVVCCLVSQKLTWNLIQE